MIRVASALALGAGLVSLGTADRWTAALHPMDKSGVTGTVQIETSGTTEATVSIAVDNAPAGSILHWRLTAGACGAAGTVVGSESAYPPLRTVEGSSKAEVKGTIKVLPQTGNQYVVEVLGPIPAPSMKEDPKMAAEKTHVIACGDLQPATMNPSF